MHLFFYRCTVACALTALVGCTSLRVVAGAGASAMPTNLNQTLSPNDALTLTSVDGARTTLHLTSVSSTSIEGIDDASSAKVSVPLSQVKLIERREFSGAKTAFLVIAIAVGVYTIAKAVAEASLLSAA